MIGILIVTHGEFGKELLRSAELIVGKQEKVLCLGLNHGDDIYQLKENVKHSIKELDTGKGVLVLTDLFGGSPSNVAAANLKDLKFKSLTGVNLPMLIEALISRQDHDLSEIVKLCYDAGVQGIKNIEEALQSQR
ncbi:PTS mannose transporter subunit IIAB [Thermoanaerobacteraceae bacterium SP2]|nr:PTS mannose transporter subunit IIAB [Thermoanaerobacteraceae bacterium SP2]